MQPTLTGLHIFYKNAMDGEVFTSSAPELLELSGLLHNKLKVKHWRSNMIKLVLLYKKFHLDYLYGVKRY